MFERMSAPATVNGVSLKYPFAGGLNAPQFSAADLNQDGIQDLVVFDRAGDIVLTFINVGTPGLVNYLYAPEYACYFPKLLNYVLLRDYNQDGAADIFCAGTSLGSQEMQVFRGYYEDNILKFKQFQFYYTGCPVCDTRYVWYPDNDQPGFWNNLPISPADYPEVSDMDGDGDLDILTFAASVGGHMWYLRNTSVENGHGLDSLQFHFEDDCWGRFYESGLAACKNNLSTNANICSNGFADETVDEREARHPGSTVMTYDQQGDGLMDVVLGDISFSCLNMMTNGGTPTTAWMTAQDTLFPSYSTPVNIAIFPAAFYLDVNNDGKKDMLVSPNNKSIGDDQKNVWFYENTANTGHSFELSTRNLFTGDMIDLGSSSHPTFADVNADGLMDLVVGTYGYYTFSNPNNARLYLFLNTGTPTAPAFTLTNDDWLGMSQYTPNDFDFAPTFGDIDADGDLDLLVGNNIGSLYVFRNTAGEGNPMTFQTDFNPMWIAMDVVGVASTPMVYDVDGDGLYDIVMGERLGFLNFFKNIGSPTQPLFNTVPTIQTLGSIDTKLQFEAIGFSAPAIVQTESGPLLVTGAQGGHLEAYYGLSASTAPFQLVSDKWGNVDDGNRSSPAFADLDGDGILELVMGNLRGGLTMYKTVLKDCGVVSTTTTPNTLPLKISPNPTSAWARIEIKTNGPVQWAAYNALGQPMDRGDRDGGIPLSIDVRTWPSGVYFIEVIADGRRGTARLLVRK